MSEERFVAIESRLDGIDNHLVEIRADVRELKTDVRELKADVAVLKTDVGGLRAGLDDLGHQMRALHEDTIERIKALAPDFSPLRREFREADAQLRDEIDRRLVPLEAAERSRHA